MLDEMIASSMKLFVNKGYLKIDWKNITKVKISIIYKKRRGGGRSRVFTRLLSDNMLLQIGSYIVDHYLYYYPIHYPVYFLLHPHPHL